MNNRNRYGLTERDMNTIFSILNKYPEVLIVHLFGSPAKGTHKFGSDVDLAIMNEGASKKTLSELRAEFEESTMPYRVDLVDFNRLEKREFLEHIERVGVPFYTADKEELLID